METCRGILLHFNSNKIDNNFVKLHVIFFFKENKDNTLKTCKRIYAKANNEPELVFRTSAKIIVMFYCFLKYKIKEISLKNYYFILYFFSPIIMR